MAIAMLIILIEVYNVKAPITDNALIFRQQYGKWSDYWTQATVAMYLIVQFVNTDFLIS